MNYRKQLFIVSYYLIVLLNINQYCWVVSVLMCVLVHHWYQWTVFNEVKINPTDASDSWQTIYHMPGGISGPSRWTGSVWTWLPHKRLSLCLWIIRLDWVKINIHLRDHKLCRRSFSEACGQCKCSLRPDLSRPASVFSLSAVTLFLQLLQSAVNKRAKTRHILTDTGWWRPAVHPG